MCENLHPLATVAMLLFKVGCPRCGENAPIARIVKIDTWSINAASPETWGTGHAHYKR
ncbi:MAG: hypothetical protein JO053_03320 [Acidobacteria bacterium]|nr:hypothetical protein [Acidobacteriota bacterium]